MRLMKNTEKVGSETDSLKAEWKKSSSYDKTSEIYFLHPEPVNMKQIREQQSAYCVSYN